MRGGGVGDRLERENQPASCTMHKMKQDHAQDGAQGRAGSRVCVREEWVMRRFLGGGGGGVGQVKRSCLTPCI
jgi:hypothetical protein